MLPKNEDRRLLRLVALTGMIGPVLFGALLVILTISQYDFMRALRWHPLDPIDWPSGLALGPYGGWMTAAFAGGGLVLMLFALGLRQLFPKSIATYLFFIAGIAMLLLMFPTDPTYSPIPKRLPSLIHDAAYVLLGISVMPGMIALSSQFKKLPEWQGYARLTWLAIIVIVPTFILKGVALYVFLLTILAWYGLISAHLWQLIGPKHPHT